MGIKGNSERKNRGGGYWFCWDNRIKASWIQCRCLSFVSRTLFLNISPAQGSSHFHAMEKEWVPQQHGKKAKLELRFKNKKQQWKEHSTFFTFHTRRWSSGCKIKNWDQGRSCLVCLSVKSRAPKEHMWAPLTGAETSQAHGDRRWRWRLRGHRMDERRPSPSAWEAST